MKNIKKLAKNPILELCVTLTKNCSTPVVISNDEKRWLLKCLEQHKTFRTGSGRYLKPERCQLNFRYMKPGYETFLMMYEQFNF